MQAHNQNQTVNEVTMSYEWPSEEYRKLAIDEAGGNETLAIERHKRDLAELERERKADAWMERQGWRTAPDGSWRNREGDIGNRIWVNLMEGMRALERKEGKP